MPDYSKIYGEKPLTNKERAMDLLQQQNFAQALPFAASACEEDAGDVEAWLIHSVACSQTGRLAEAEQHCRQALSIAPEHTGAQFALAGILQGQGKLDETASLYQALLAQHPDAIEILNNLGSVLRSLGRLGEAQEHLNRAHTLRPNGPIILNNLGLVEKDRGNLAGAVEFYQQALSNKPDYGEACYNLANIQQLQGLVSEAESNYRKAIEYQSDLVMAYHALGQLLGSRGEMDEALTILERARETQPDFTDIAAAIAEIHEKKGDYRKASEILEPLLGNETVSPGTALCFARLAPRQNRQQEAIERLEQQLTNPALPPMVKKELHFALGDLQDSLGEFERAFGHYQQGNTAETGPDAIDNSLAQIQVIGQVFNTQSPSHDVRSDNTSEQPVFIVGMPRSGTTLVEQILASHPQITGAGELPYLGDLLNSFPGRFGPTKSYPTCIDELSAPELGTLARVYLEGLSSHGLHSARITDKMPHNFLHLGFIDRILPHARVIHCVRDPLDTCLSIYFHNFSTNHPYADSLEQLGVYYKAYRGLMEHWKKVLRIPVLDVAYEDLVADQETVSRKMIDFCGLDWDAQCLRFHESERVVTTPSYSQVRQPLYTRSVNRWKNYENFLLPLKTALE